MLRLELLCSSSKFKEKMIRLDVPVVQTKSLIRELQKAVRRKEENVEDVRYIG